MQNWKLFGPGKIRVFWLSSPQIENGKKELICSHCRWGFCLLARHRSDIHILLAGGHPDHKGSRDITVGTRHCVKAVEVQHEKKGNGKINWNEKGGRTISQYNGSNKRGNERCWGIFSQNIQKRQEPTKSSQQDKARCGSSSFCLEIHFLRLFQQRSDFPLKSLQELSLEMGLKNKLKNLKMC